MDTNKKQNYLTIVLVVLVVASLFFVRGLNIKTNQEALSLKSNTISDTSSIDPNGSYEKVCPNPAVTFSLDPLNPSPNTLVQGQQSYQVFVFNAVAGHCTIKLNSLTIEQTGTMNANDIEKAELYVEYPPQSGGAFYFVSPLTVTPINPNGTYKYFSFNTSNVNTIIPAYSGQPNSGVQAVRFRVLVSVSPDVSSGKTVKLKILNGSSFATVDKNGNPVTSGGLFPIVNNQFQTTAGVASLTQIFSNNITSTSALLHATVPGSTFGNSAYGYFYATLASQNILLNPGTATSYQGPLPLNGISISESLSGLSPATNYKYRSCVSQIYPNSNLWNTYKVCGKVKNFTTLP